MARADVGHRYVPEVERNPLLVDSGKAEVMSPTVSYYRWLFSSYD